MRPKVISEFQCQEKFYSYLTKRLSEDEKIKVEKALGEYTDCRQQLKNMEKTFSYCLQLRRVLPDKETVQDLTTKKSFFKKIFLVFLHRNFKYQTLKLLFWNLFTGKK